MTRDEIQRKACAYFPEVVRVNDRSVREIMVTFAIAVHDAAKEEDAKIADNYSRFAYYPPAIAKAIRASKVNK